MERVSELFEYKAIEESLHWRLRKKTEQQVEKLMKEMEEKVIQQIAVGELHKHMLSSGFPQYYAACLCVITGNIDYFLCSKQMDLSS